MLHLPRLELLLFMMVLPMVVAASATLLRGPGAVHVAVGVIFAVLLPLAFLGTALGFVVHYLVRNSVERRRAVFVLQLPPGAAAGGGGGGDAATSAAAGVIGGGTADAAGAAVASPRRTLSQQQGQQQGRPELLGRDSLTEQFLTSRESSFRAAAGSGATFVSASSLPGDAGPGPTPIASGQLIADRQDSMVQPDEGAPQHGGGATAGAAEPRGRLRRGVLAVQRWLFRPLFGFELVNAGAAQQQPSVASIPVGTAADGGVVVGQGAWLCKSKWDTAFVKRYGSLFEDARGPQVYHITSVYESDEGEWARGTWGQEAAAPAGRAACHACPPCPAGCVACRAGCLGTEGDAHRTASPPRHSLLPVPCRRRAARRHRRARPRLLHLV